MNGFTYWGLGIAVLVTVIYITIALYKKTKPDLPTAITILISTASVLGAVRLAGFAFTDQFKRVIQAQDSNSWWSLGPEDAVFLVIGGLALGWVSLQEVCRGFRELSKEKNS